MGILFHSCAEVHEPIELSFGVVSWVSGGMDVLDGGSRISRGLDSFGGLLSPLVSMAYF